MIVPLLAVALLATFALIGVALFSAMQNPK